MHTYIQYIPTHTYQIRFSPSLETCFLVFFNSFQSIFSLLQQHQEASKSIGEHHWASFFIGSSSGIFHPKWEDQQPQIQDQSFGPGLALRGLGSKNEFGGCHLPSSGLFEASETERRTKESATSPSNPAEAPSSDFSAWTAQGVVNISSMCWFQAPSSLKICRAAAPNPGESCFKF